MTAPILIAHDPDDQASVDLIAEAVRAAGYEVAHNGTVMVGESFTEEASKILAMGGGVIVCATVRALGRGWIHHLTHAARSHRAGRVRVFALQMEEDAYTQPIALDAAIAAYWQDPHEAIRQIVTSLKRYFPLSSSCDGPTVGENQDNVEVLDQLTAIADFDRQALFEFRSQLRDDVEERFPATMAEEEFLQAAQVMVRGLLTRAGELLFGRNPPIPFAVKCTSYSGTTRASERETLTVHDTVPRQIIAARDFIAKRIGRTEYPSGDRAKADVRYQFPMICVREMLANALVHRDYGVSRRHVSMRLFQDRIEILSPGEWIPHSLADKGQVPLSDLQSESIQRNPTLAHVLSWITFVELEGSGIPTGLEDCRIGRAPVPSVLEEAGFVKVTIWPGADWESINGKHAMDLPESITAYVTRLADETSCLKLLGLGRSLQIELPIEEAYVPLRTTLARSLEQRGTERFMEQHAEFEEDVNLGDVFREAARLGQRGVILLGEPGSGKTTGARQIAWRLASRQCLPEELGLPTGMTPVLLRLRNLSRAALAEQNGLRMFLSDETRCNTAPDGLAAPGNDLWNGSSLLWILDGLDEVIDPDARKTVSRWVEEALGGRTNDRFLVTCRFAGFYREGVPMLGPSFVEFHVRPLDDAQVERFVRDWFGAAYRKLLHPPALAETRSDKLLEVLSRSAYQSGQIRQLCTNPLLLTILCIVFHDEQTLPTNRAELYAICVRVLLQHWRRDLYESELGRGIQPLDAEAAQAVLARLAWWMHGEQHRTAAPLDELAAEAERGLADVATSCGLGKDGRAFVQRMKDETGVLVGEGDGRCGFLHLSIQEYLAADYAARENLAQELASRAADSWWREVALLSLRRSRPFCESFFREMLAAGVAEEHPDLADRCLAEALFFLAAPFLETLEHAVSPRRVAAVLRLLRDRADQIPELADVARRLAVAGDRETRSFAREILGRLNVTLPQAGDERKVILDDRTGMTFFEIPAGEFQMGSETSAAYDDERPIHRVRISRGYWLAKYPVTNAQYAQFMRATSAKVEKPRYWDDRRFNQPEQPVVGVSWNDAQTFCEWAGCRLPTEAEWEYACRAGTSTEYSFGDDGAMLREFAWYDKNSGGQTQPVGTKQPNAWNLFDMHGNVWEWCQDWFGGYSSESHTDPKGPESGAGRVLRAGSWYDGARLCRSTIRYGVRPGFRIYYIGFRVART